MRSLAFAPDGSGILASGSEDKTIRLWDTRLPAECAHLKTLASQWTQDYDNHELHELYGNGGGYTSYAQCQREYEERHSSGGHRSYVQCLAFAPDGSGVLASGSYDDQKDNAGGTDFSIHLWNTRLSEEDAYLKVLKRHTDHVNFLAFSPDGRYLISGSLNEILVWNAKHWNKAPLCFPFGSSCLAWQGNLLAVSHNNSVHVINVMNYFKAQKFRWVMISSPTLWLQGCNITQAKGVSWSTQQQLKNEGVIGEPIKTLIKQTNLPSFANNLYNFFSNTKIATGSGRAAATALKRDELSSSPAVGNKSVFCVIS